MVAARKRPSKKQPYRTCKRKRLAMRKDLRKRMTEVVLRGMVRALFKQLLYHRRANSKHFHMINKRDMENLTRAAVENIKKAENLDRFIAANRGMLKNGKAKPLRRKRLNSVNSLTSDDKSIEEGSLGSTNFLSKSRKRLKQTDDQKNANNRKFTANVERESAYESNSSWLDISNILKCQKSSVGYSKCSKIEGAISKTLTVCYCCKAIKEKRKQANAASAEKMPEEPDAKRSCSSIESGKDRNSSELIATGSSSTSRCSNFSELNF